MLGIRDIALGFLLPAVLCGAILAIARNKKENVGEALSGLAFAGPWLLAYVVLAGEAPAWPGSSRVLGARDWLAWVVALSGLFACIRLAPRASGTIAPFARPLLSAALTYLCLRLWVQRTGSYPILAIAFVLVLGVWLLADRWIARAPGPRAPLALLAAAAGASVANLLASGAMFALLAAALATCLGAAAVVAFFAPAFRLRPSASAVVLLVVSGSALIGYVFNKVPLSSALLLGAALLAPDLVRSRESTWRSTLLAAGLALVPAALAAWFAWTPGKYEY